MKNFTLVFIILLKASFLFAQNDSILKMEIDKKTWKVEKIKEQKLSFKQIKIDTINCNVSVYKKFVEANCILEKSQKQISIIFYKSDSRIEKISVREDSSMPEDFWREFVFYYKNDTIFDMEERQHFHPRLHGIAGRMLDDVYKQYNKNINFDFLKEFCEKINKQL